MRQGLVKAAAYGMIAALLFAGNGLDVKAAAIGTSSLPAAGFGLALGDGASVSEIRENVKKKSESEEIEADTESAAETETETDSEETLSQENETVETESESVPAEDETGTDSVEEGTAEETEADADIQTDMTEEPETEIEIVEPVTPALKTPEDVLIIAQVNNYVNIRREPNTEAEIVGKLYNNSVGTLIATEGDWYQMKSGSVEGYVKAEYFKTGDEARQIADAVGDRIATVNTQTLRVRCEPSLDAPVLGLIGQGEELTVLDEQNGFVKVSIEEGDGWTSTDYVILRTDYVTAESVEEERSRLAKEEADREAARKAAEEAEARMQAEDQAQTDGAEAAPAETVPAMTVGGSGMGVDVVNYALQFVGNPYRRGGTSLTNGADCSGFVMSVYQHFGVSLPHSSSADRKVGYAVNGLAEAQPGDLVCYSGHVALYIGNGQIVHASTTKTGIKVSDASYRKILAVRRIF